MSASNPVTDAPMPANKRERDMARAGYAAALTGRMLYSRDMAERLAVTRYPAPMIERPRVFKSPTGAEFRVANGLIESRHPIYGLTGWTPVMSVSEATYRGIADLIAHPTETVEADD